MLKLYTLNQNVNELKWHTFWQRENCACAQWKMTSSLSEKFNRKKLQPLSFPFIVFELIKNSKSLACHSLKQHPRYSTSNGNGWISYVLDCIWNSNSWHYASGECEKIYAKTLECTHRDTEWKLIWKMMKSNCVAQADGRTSVK